MTSFIEIVRAENFPQKIQWTRRDTFAVLILPLIFLNSYLFSLLNLAPVQVGLADSIFRGMLFLIVCFLYKTMLIQHWKHFKAAFWRSTFLVVLGAIILQLVISLTRKLLPVDPISSVKKSIDPEQVAFISLLIISFGPLFTALLEDIVFRYTLLHKLFVQPWLWKISLILLNSILFGLIHYHNFDGNLIATISFMVAGLFLNLIYLWTRNIWHVLLIHFLNNAVLSLGAVILLKIFSYIQ